MAFVFIGPAWPRFLGSATPTKEKPGSVSPQSRPDDPLTSSMNNLTHQQRHALKLLADAGPRGMPEALLLMNDISPTITAALMASGLAKAATESIRAGDRKIDVPRVAITEAGRAASTARN
jgi:hypothetical protein